MQTLADMRDDATIVARVAGMTLTICAGIALLLTAIGLYGHVSMWAAERRAEIGIRIALGAPTIHVHRLLLGGVGRLVVVGGILGGAAAVGVLRLERAWIGPVLSLELGPMLAAFGALMLAAGLAAFLPSRRAASTSPADVMRPS